ncbi:MAG: hypothetical protein H7288_13655 [Kineosporiaceae bacterium]|nr:hypothetical protein [Aeromicrobium sp.]
MKDELALIRDLQIVDTNVDSEFRDALRKNLIATTSDETPEAISGKPRRRVRRVLVLAVAFAATIAAGALGATIVGREGPVTNEIQSASGQSSVIARTANGDTTLDSISPDGSFCATFASAVTWASSSQQCGVQLPASGVFVGWICSTAVDGSHPTFSVRAIVADDVTAVQLRLADGSLEDTPVEHNVLEWSTSNREMRPAQLLNKRGTSAFQTDGTGTLSC